MKKELSAAVSGRPEGIRSTLGGTQKTKLWLADQRRLIQLSVVGNSRLLGGFSVEVSILLQEGVLKHVVSA